MSNMKNIAIINTNDWGSTGKIAFGLLDNFKQRGYKAIFCYGRGKRTKSEPTFKFNFDIEVYIHYFLYRLTGRQCIGSRFATKRLIRRLKQESIDTIYAINLHGYYLNEELFLKYIAENDIRLVYIMADESPFLGMCTYHHSCENYKNRCVNCPRKKGWTKVIQPKSAEMAYDIKERYYTAIEHSCFVAPEFVINKAVKSPLMFGKKLEILDEAIDTDFFSPKDTTSLRKELSIEESKIVIVCVAPLSYTRKGVCYFIEAARKLEHDDRFVFLHVGYDRSDRTGLPKNLQVFSPIYDQSRLSLFYSIADLFVFPSTNDTMPNACLEALSSGSPLLCFDISGMPYILDETVGTLVEARNVDQMVEVISRTPHKSQETINRCREYALKRYNNKEYAAKLIQIGESL